MDIMGALKQEEAKLERQLTAVQGAIAALNDGAKTAPSRGDASSPSGTRAKWTLSAAARARMSRAAKLRWAKIKAEKSKNRKTKKNTGIG
jgi:hypothetical protein